MNIFYSIYNWFIDVNSPIFTIMNNHVSGDDETVTLLSSSLPTIGITAAIISFVVAFAYYIWPINHPRFKSWWSWLIMLVINAAINFGLAFAFLSHRISDVMMNNEVMENLSDTDTMGGFIEDNVIVFPVSGWIDFALSNACVSSVFFICASLILMWFRTNCRFSPFRR